MPIAIQEDMLPGRTPLEKFQTAQALGIEGIEFWGRDLPRRIHDIAEAMDKTGIRAAAVNYGRQGRLLDPHPLERERALAELRDAITCASDAGAAGVVFVPHYFGALLPDLSPYKSAEELQAELLYTHLRTLSDFADAMNVDLYIEPVNRYETTFLNRLEQAGIMTRKLNHSRVKIAANLFHMALEEDHLPDALRAHADQLGYLHLADSNRRLPGQGALNFALIAAALHEMDYAGWLGYECGTPGENAPRAAEYGTQLPASLDAVRRAGLR